VLLADPGRWMAGEFFEQARRDWSVATSVRDGIEIHRLLAIPRSPRASGGQLRS
jgi:hypothetical protein